MRGSDENTVSFEEILFLRIAFEFSKMYRIDRSEEFIEALESMMIDYETYNDILEMLVSKDDSDRMIVGEWVKFSLQLPIEEEVVRRNLVTLMFNFIS
jgi:hypothetical protein